MFQGLKSLVLCILRIHSDKIYLLNNSTTIHIQRQVQDLTFHPIRQDFLLVLITMFKEFLYHPVTKDVYHQLRGVLL